MGRTRLTLTTWVVAAAAVAVVATSGWAQPAASPTSLHLVATSQDHVGFQDVHQPPRPGDRVGFGEKITGDDTGIDRGVCTLVSKDEELCTAEVRLSKGTLTAQSLLRLAVQPQSSQTSWAITGGTGAYDGARGTAVVTNVEGSPRSDIQITLKP